MPGFEDIIGQQHPIRFLQAFLRNATLPHALLLTGISGIGKRLTAKAVAMTLNCSNAKAASDDRPDACGRCRSCRQIGAGTHPDVIQIEPQGNYLRIDQIRKLLSIVALKPFTAANRVVIIAASHLMNQEASNALLKVLEEPPADTTLILTAPNKTDLLSTIVSRCRHIRFNRLNKDELVKCMSRRHGTDTQELARAATLADGSLTKAEQLLDPQRQAEHDWVIQAAGLDREGVLDKRSISTALAFAGQLAAQKEKVPDLLDILKIWIRDLAIRPYQPELVLHRNDENVLDRIRRNLDNDRLLAIWAAVEKAQKDIAAK